MAVEAAPAVDDQQIVWAEESAPAVEEQQIVCFEDGFCMRCQIMCSKQIEILLTAPPLLLTVFWRVGVCTVKLCGGCSMQSLILLTAALSSAKPRSKLLMKVMMTMLSVGIQHQEEWKLIVAGAIYCFHCFE